jgi:hypothetical protein
MLKSLDCVFENKCTTVVGTLSKPLKNVNAFRHNVAILVAYRNRYVIKYSRRLFTYSIVL